MARIIEAHVAYRGYLTVTVARLEGDDGAVSLREVEDHGRAACVLPYDPQRRVALMVRMPRAPLLLAGEIYPLFEAPAGMIDGDESAEDAARREALEEAGLSLGALEPVARVWASPGVSGERTSLFLAPYEAASRTGEGGGVAGEHEDIAVSELPLAELAAMADDGRLCDLKTLALVLALRLRRPDLFA